MARAVDRGPGLSRHWVDVSCLLGILWWATSPLIRVHSAVQQTLGIHTMLFQFRPTVLDPGPTLKQHWVNDSCLQGIGYQPLCCGRGVFVLQKHSEPSSYVSPSVDI